MHIIVTGGRWFNDTTAVHGYISYLMGRYQEDLVIIQGGAPGADTIAKEFCETTSIPVETYEADWEHCGPECPPVHMKANSRGSLYCPTAGHRRNQAMLDALPRAARDASQPSGGVVAFIDRKLEDSRGTNDMVKRANEASVPVRVIFAKQLRADAHPPSAGAEEVTT